MRQISQTSTTIIHLFIHPFRRLINMFHIFVYLARNKLKLKQTYLSSLGTKQVPGVRGRGKIHVVLPLASISWRRHCVWYA